MTKREPPGVSSSSLGIFDAEAHPLAFAGQVHARAQHPDGRRPRELLECLLQVAEVRVRGVVVELDVRDHRDVAAELQKRAI